MGDGRGKVVVWLQTKKRIKIGENKEGSLYTIIKKKKTKPITFNLKKTCYLNVQSWLFLDFKQTL